ncbi:MAG TPA: DUF2690 domain-containing protein [Ktedonobacteraceae bacterium]|nr:DUF2690 domain-containing protein [Ktedonobacteraceae bacterium]
MARIRVLLFSTALLLVLFGTAAFSGSKTASASTLQAHQSQSQHVVQSGGRPGAVKTTTRSSAQVTCSGNGCNGQNPVTTGCNADAYTVQTAVFSNSYVELRYSPTCGTNWARVTSKVGLANLVARIQRIDGLTYTFSGGKFYYAYSVMVYAPTLAARACGGVNGISGCTAYV